MQKLRSLRLWAIIFLCLIVAIIRFPIALAAHLIPAPWILQGATGTIWQGEAAALGLGGMVLQQHVRWQFQPNALLGARLTWQIQGEFREEKSHLALTFRPGTITLHQLALHLPLEPLLNQSSRIKPLRLGALLRLKADTLSLNTGTNIDGQIENLSSGLTPTSNPFGSYKLHLDMQGNGRVNWQVSTLNGALKASGQGGIDIRKGGMTGVVNLLPDEEALLSLKPILSILPKNETGYTLNLSGKN